MHKSTQTHSNPQNHHNLLTIFIITSAAKSASPIFIVPHYHTNNEEILIIHPSIAYDDAACCLLHQHCSGELATKCMHQAEPTVADFSIVGPEFQNKSRKRIGMDLYEEIWFHSFFGSATMALLVWNMLHKFHPLNHEAQILHLLWAIFFMTVYPYKNVACAMAGGQGEQLTIRLFTRIYGQWLKPLQIWNNIL